MECREKSRITLSIKQLEEDPLLETLDKVIPKVCNMKLSCVRVIMLLVTPFITEVSLSPVRTEHYTLQDASAKPESMSVSNNNTIEPLPGLGAIFEELLLEDGY